MTLENALTGELATIKIPPRPAVLLNIQREMRSAEPDFSTIESIISLDVGISASLIKVANSPMFGASRPVRSVKDALRVLGLNAVASAIAAFALRQSFANVPNLERFWDSSARIAQLSGWLAGHLALPGRRLKTEEAYTFGLFRDCGIPILMSMYSDYFDILKAANSDEIRPFTATEQAELDVDHAMIGAMLITEWELPSEFAAALENHHDVTALLAQGSKAIPDISRCLIATAQLAEYLFQSLTGLNKTCEWPKLGAACLQVLHLDDAGLEHLLTLARDEGVHTQPAI